MRLQIWLLCCVFLTTLAEEHVTEGNVTTVETTTDGVFGNNAWSENRLHHSDANLNGTDMKFNSTYAPVEILDSNRTVSYEARTDDALGEVAARIDDSIVTMPYQLDNSTVAPGTHGNGTEAADLVESRIHEEGFLAQAASDVTERLEFDVGIEDSTEATAGATVNSTQGDEAAEFDDQYLRLHVANSTDIMAESTNSTTDIMNNSTHGDAVNEFDNSLLRYEDTTDVAEIANSTIGNVATLTSNYNDDRFGNDDPTVPVLHAELIKNEDLIDLQPSESEPLPVEVPNVHVATTVPWMMTATLLDATPVMSDLDRISEDENEASELPSVTPQQNTTQSTTALSTHDGIEARFDDVNMHMNASALSDIVASVLESQIQGYKNDTELDIASRALVGESREYLRHNEGFCLAIPYPCGPGKTCIVVGNRVECVSSKGGCNPDPYPCAADEACKMIRDEPVCYPSLGVCIAAPYPCNHTDACRVVDKKVACYPNHCLGVTCSDHGICKELGYDYRCECDHGYQGRNCEEAVLHNLGPCEPNPCRGDCVCQESCKHELGYYCASAGGFTGKNCAVPVPKVTCGERSIMVDITEDLYQEFDHGVGNTYFYVAPESGAKSSNCEASKTRDGFRITIPLPFTNCHSRIARTGSSLTVRNRVIADRRSSKFSMETPVVDFQCVYRRQYRLITSLKPVVTEPVRREGYGRFRPEVELCKISNCPNSCPLEYSVAKGAVYTVGELIYFSISALPMGAFEDYVTVVSGMAISCDEAGSSSNGIELLRDGCPVDESLYMTVAPGRVACASLQTPRSACATFYIHLHITLCHNAELVPCSSGQILRCAGSTRQARSIHRMDKYADAKIGPITIIEGNIGVEEIELYPGASNTTFKLNTKKGDAPNPVRPTKKLYTILLTTAIPCLFLAISVALLSLACCRRVNRVTNARVKNAKGFRKLDTSPPPAYYAPSVAGCKFCGLIEPLCRCGNRIAYTSTKLHAVGVSGLCPCCTEQVCKCGVSCQSCSCSPKQCSCGCATGSACSKCQPNCKLCSCKC